MLYVVINHTNVWVGIIHGTKEQQGRPYVKNQGQWWTQNWFQQQRPQKYQFFHSGNNNNNNVQ